MDAPTGTATLDGRVPAVAVPAPTPAFEPPPSPAPRRKSEARPLPVRDAAYAHLSVAALRALRTQLTEEESRVSYWRRILQARLDVVQTGTGRGLDTARLRPVLSPDRVRAGRTAIVEVLQRDDVPPLPRLDELWERQVPVDDPAATAALETDLRSAEHELSVYRVALHLRITEATGELIARYREQPDLCLSALPLDPRRPGALAD